MFQKRRLELGLQELVCSALIDKKFRQPRAILIAVEANRDADAAGRAGVGRDREDVTVRRRERVGTHPIRLILSYCGKP